MGERISNFQAYRIHVELATSFLERAAEIKLLRQCGREEWAITLQAFLSGHQRAGLLHLDRVNPCWYLAKVDLAHDGKLLLDEICQVERDRLKLEATLHEEKIKANRKAATLLAMDCRTYGGWT